MAGALFDPSAGSHSFRYARPTTNAVRTVAGDPLGTLFKIPDGTDGLRVAAGQSAARV